MKLRSGKSSLPSWPPPARVISTPCFNWVVSPDYCAPEKRWENCVNTSAPRPAFSREICERATQDGHHLQLLDPEILLNADDVAVKTAAANKAKGAPPFQSEMRGATVVAETFKGRALGAQLALINGSVGTTWIAGGKPRVAFLFSIENGRIQGIDVVMDPEDLKEMEVQPLGNCEPTADR